jgi:hypothetical protein
VGESGESSSPSLPRPDSFLKVSSRPQKIVRIDVAGRKVSCDSGDGAEGFPQRESKVMKRLGPISTRRQLFRVMAAGAASVPFVASTGGSASALPPSFARPNCLLKGTSCKTVGRGVFETLYEVNRTRHV